MCVKIIETREWWKNMCKYEQEGWRVGESLLNIVWDGLFS